MKSTLLVRTLPALLLLIVAGCGDYARRYDRGLLIHPQDAATLGYAVNWATGLDVPRHSKLASATVLGDMLVTVESPTNMVTAVSLRDGSVLWRRVIGETTQQVYPPVRDEQYVYFNNDTNFYTVNAITGVLVSTSRLANVVETGPVMVGHFAIFGAANGIVFAHDVETGYAKWSYKLTAGIVVSPLQLQQFVLAADSQGVYAGLDALSGELRYRGRAFGPITAKPAANRGSVFIASQDQSLYAINAFTGSDQWVYRSTGPLTGDPVALGPNVYLPGPDGGLIVLNATDKTELWETNVNAKAITDRDNRVLLMVPEGLQWADEADGRVITDVPTQPLRYVLNDGAGGLLLISDGGRIHRLVPKR